MAKLYKLLDSNTVYHTGLNVSVPVTAQNAHGKEYIAWLAAGNVPDPVRTPAEELAYQTAQIKRVAEAQADAIAPLRDQVAMLAEYVQILEAKVDGLPYDQARKDALQAQKDAIKAIRDKAAADIGLLGG